MHLNEEIIRLYGEGKSAQRIADDISVSIKTVYRKLIQSGVKRRNAGEQSRIRYALKPLTYSFKEKLDEKDTKLMLSALMLYKGEGAKTGKTVDFVNSDAKALKVFLTFLRKICRVDESKLRIYLYCFSDQNPQEIIFFWSQFLSIPTSQFTKPYVRETQIHARKKLTHGVIHMRYNDKKLLVKILYLCEKVLDDLLV